MIYSELMWPIGNWTTTRPPKTTDSRQGERILVERIRIRKRGVAVHGWAPTSVCSFQCTAEHSLIPSQTPWPCPSVAECSQLCPALSPASPLSPQSIQVGHRVWNSVKPRCCASIVQKQLQQHCLTSLVWVTDLKHCTLWAALRKNWLLSSQMTFCTGLTLWSQHQRDISVIHYTWTVTLEQYTTQSFSEYTALCYPYLAQTISAQHVPVTNTYVHTQKD